MTTTEIQNILLKHRVIIDHLTQSIASTTATSGGETLTEMGLTIDDLKNEVSEIAMSCDRRNTSDASEWRTWFTLSEDDKSDLIKLARVNAAKILK